MLICRQDCEAWEAIGVVQRYSMTMKESRLFDAKCRRESQDDNFGYEIRTAVCPSGIFALNSLVSGLSR